MDFTKITLIKNEKKINKPQISRYDFQKRIEEYVDP